MTTSLLPFLLACSLGSPKTPSSPTPPAAPVVPPVPSVHFEPPTLDYGETKLVLSGAWEGSLEAVTVSCARDLGRTFLGATASEPVPWRVSGFTAPDSDGTGETDSVNLALDGVGYRLSSQPADLRAGRLDLEAATFIRRDGEDSLTVTGTLRCPDEAGPTWPEGLKEHIAQVTGANVRPYLSQDFGRHQDPRGLSVKLPQDDAPAKVAALRQSLGEGWLVWQGTSRDLSGSEPGVEVVVAPGKTISELILLADVDPVNFGLSSHQVAAWVAEREARWGLVVQSADTEHMALDLGPQADPAEVAKEVAELCPDVVYQGVGTVEALEEAIRSSRQLYCWWD